MFDDDDESIDSSIFDVSAVDYKIPKPRRPNEFTITFTDHDGLSFNLIKIRGSLLKVVDQIERELNIMEESDEQ